MQRGFGFRKSVLFATFISVALLAVLNVVAWPFVRVDSVFWDNPLMLMYPVDTLDPDVTLARANYSKDQDRPVKYVPDEHRWYRLDPEPVIPSEGELVLHFGDSSTWGWGLRDRNGAYPGALSEYLPDSVCSINLGVPGYSSLQGLRYLEEVLSAHHERVAAVTLYFGNNDATENGAPDAEKLAAPPKPRMPQWLGGLPLVQLVQRCISPLLAEDNQKPRVSPDEYQANMSAMIFLAQSYGIPVVAIAPPAPLSWPPGHLTRLISLAPQVSNDWVVAELWYAQLLYREGVEFLESYDDRYEPRLRGALEHDWVIPRIKPVWHERLKAVCIAHEVPLVALSEPFVPAEYPHAFEDYCHPSARVHTLIARKIASALGYR